MVHSHCDCSWLRIRMNGWLIVRDGLAMKSAGVKAYLRKKSPPEPTFPTGNPPHSALHARLSDENAKLNPAAETVSIQRSEFLD